MPTEDQNLLKGIRFPPRPTQDTLHHVTRVPHGKFLLQLLHFQPWPEFEEIVNRTKKRVEENLNQNGCISSNSLNTTNCQGNFRACDCTYTFCRRLADRKEKASTKKGIQFRKESQLTQTFIDLVETLCEMAGQLEGHKYEAASEYRNVDSTIVDTYLDSTPAIRVKSLSDHPDLFITIRCPQIPSQLHYIGNSKIVETDISENYELYFDYLRKKNPLLNKEYLYSAITQAVIYALHTGTGYGCLSTYNEAVFFSVEPQKNAGGSHYCIVKTSQIYSCNPGDDDQASLFHGILGLILEGKHQGSMKNYEKQKELIDWFLTNGSVWNSSPAKRKSEIVMQQDLERQQRYEQRKRVKESKENDTRGLENIPKFDKNANSNNLKKEV